MKWTDFASHGTLLRAFLGRFRQVGTCSSAVKVPNNVSFALARCYQVLWYSLALDRCASRYLLSCLQSGVALMDPSLLQSFVVTSFIDPKRFIFKSWCLFPALKPHKPFMAEQLRPLAEFAPPSHAAAIAEACDSHLRSTPELPAWVVVREAPSASETTTFRTLPLTEGLATLLASETEAFLAFSDPSSLRSSAGWPLRNILMLLSFEVARAGLSTALVPVVCVRLSQGAVCPSSCLATRVACDALPQDWPRAGDDVFAYGWEVGHGGKPGPRTVDLRDQMDPLAMAEVSAWPDGTDGQGCAIWAMCLVWSQLRAGLLDHPPRLECAERC